MHIVFDEHISPKIVQALAENVRMPPDYDLISIYRLGLTSTEDETWLEKYSDSGGVYFVSGDRKMLNRPTLLSIISTKGLTGFYYRKEFSKQRRIMQLAYAAYWWEPIQEKILSSVKSSAWIVPNEFGGTTLKQVDIAAAMKGISASN